MKTLRRYIPVILWSGVIFLFSSWETPPSPQDTLLNFLLKKTAHLVEYAILYYLSYRAFSDGPEFSRQGKFAGTPEPRTRALATRGRSPREQVSVVRGRRYFYPLIFTLIYAVSDEIHQSFVSGRHGRAADVLIDAAGALIALMKMKLRNHSHSPSRFYGGAESAVAGEKSPSLRFNSRSLRRRRIKVFNSRQ